MHNKQPAKKDLLNGQTTTHGMGTPQRNRIHFRMPNQKWA